MADKLKPSPQDNETSGHQAFRVLLPDGLLENIQQLGKRNEELEEVIEGLRQELNAYGSEPSGKALEDRIQALEEKAVREKTDADLNMFMAAAVTGLLATPPGEWEKSWADRVAQAALEVADACVNRLGKNHRAAASPPSPPEPPEEPSIELIKDSDLKRRESVSNALERTNRALVELRRVAELRYIADKLKGLSIEVEGMLRGKNERG